MMLDSLTPLRTLADACTSCLNQETELRKVQSMEALQYIASEHTISQRSQLQLPPPPGSYPRSMAEDFAFSPALPNFNPNLGLFNPPNPQEPPSLASSNTACAHCINNLQDSGHERRGSAVEHTWNQPSEDPMERRFDEVQQEIGALSAQVGALHHDQIKWLASMRDLHTKLLEIETSHQVARQSIMQQVLSLEASTRFILKDVERGRKRKRDSSGFSRRRGD